MIIMMQMKDCYKERVKKMIDSYLVWAATALHNQDPHHLTVVETGGDVNWESALPISQQRVSPCL